MSTGVVHRVRTCSSVHWSTQGEDVFKCPLEVHRVRTCSSVHWSCTQDVFKCPLECTQGEDKCPLELYTG